MADDEPEAPEPTPGVFIPFTQFLRPNSVRQTIQFPCDKVLWNKAQKIFAAGYELHTEVLQTGQVSFTICHPEVGDMAIEVCRNGPEVPIKIVGMILKFDITIANRKVEQELNDRSK